MLITGLAAGCHSSNNGSTPALVVERMIKAGPANQYAADGVYSAFVDRGFFVVRRGDELFALSAICTHRNCKLTAEADHSFYCQGHGSTFDPVGQVTQGPAKRDLPLARGHQPRRSAGRDRPRLKQGHPFGPQRSAGSVVDQETALPRILRKVLARMLVRNRSEPIGLDPRAFSLYQSIRTKT